MTFFTYAAAPTLVHCEKCDKVILRSRNPIICKNFTHLCEKCGLEIYDYSTIKLEDKIEKWRELQKLVNSFYDEALREIKDKVAQGDLNYFNAWDPDATAEDIVNIIVRDPNNDNPYRVKKLARKRIREILKKLTPEYLKFKTAQLCKEL